MTESRPTIAVHVSPDVLSLTIAQVALEKIRDSVTDTTFDVYQAGRLAGEALDAIRAFEGATTS
jgi:hypothetical protein